MTTKIEAQKVQLSAGAVITMLVLSVVLVTPALQGVFTDHDARAIWEKRKLKSWPGLPPGDTAEPYFSGLEAFIDDHIGFALPLNQAYRKLLFYGLGDSPVANVSVGRNGFIFLNSHSVTTPNANLETLCLDQQRRNRTPHIRQSIESISRALTAQGLEATFAIFPSKPLLYPGQLPDSVPLNYRVGCNLYSTQTDFIFPQGYEHELGFYYPLQELRENRHRSNFFPPANFHAKGLSAHEFSQGLLSKMGISMGADYSLGARQERGLADLQMLGFKRYESSWVFPYKQYAVSRKRRQPSIVLQYYTEARDFSHFHTQYPASERVVLIISNSYGAYVAPHLAPGFRDVYHININQLKNDEVAPLLLTMLEAYPITDFVYLVQDAALLRQYRLSQIQQALNF